MTSDKVETMTLVEIARRLAELGQADKALNAYTAALKQENVLPEERLEAACAVLQYGEDYKLAYDALLALYAEGTFRADALEILTGAFYEPNEKKLRERYERNCRLLKKYPYLFRKDFLPFAELPVKFYPYDDNGVLPFYEKEERFDPYLNVNEPVIRHHFFHDLEKPILAHDIVSQYELEYLNDNVRRSDWVARENHIYLHYADWGVFCSYLALLDLKPLLMEKKFVFLIADELAQYPIDFQERFGIDYSAYPVKPIGVREIHKIIWHTQLFAHNGGDFFNEIFFGHPNLLAGDSIWAEDLLKLAKDVQRVAQKVANKKDAWVWEEDDDDSVFRRAVLEELASLKRVTLKDAFVAIHLGTRLFGRHTVDPAERIVPALFFQPHFGRMKFFWKPHESGAIQYESDALEEIRAARLLDQFKYVKTFTPFRRPTTSHGATVNFLNWQMRRGASCDKNDEYAMALIPDLLADRVQNRSFMAAKGDHLFDDSCIVRFEDAKLNPTATFTALAAFLDLPYTESMTYCSDAEGLNPNDRGFKTDAVYRTYDTMMDESERIFIEYFLHDVYEAYGYDFQVYDGKPMTQEEVEQLLPKCRRNLELMEESWWSEREKLVKKYEIPEEDQEEIIRSNLDRELDKARERRLLTTRIMNYHPTFCDAEGRKLEFIPMLQPVPELMQEETYH